MNSQELVRELELKSHEAAIAFTNYQWLDGSPCGQKEGE